MINFYWRAGLLCVCFGFLAEAVWAQNPTIFYRSSGGNPSRECVGGPNDGQPCTSAASCEVGPDCERLCVGGANDGLPCEVLSDCPSQGAESGTCVQRCFCNYVVQPFGQTVNAELRARNWGQRLTSYQARVDFTEIIDRVHPQGWTCIDLETFCSSDDDCPPETPYCWHDPVTGLGLACACRFHRPEDFVYIDPDPLTGNTRTDWVFAGLGPFQAIELTSPQIAFLAATSGTAVAYTGTKEYLATLNLFIESNACGDIDIPLVPPTDTVLLDGNDPIEPLDLESITLRLDPCVCERIVNHTSMPENCTLDARQDSEPVAGSPQGWSQIALLLDCDDTSNVFRTRFTLRTVPSTTTGPPDSRTANVPDGGWITLNFPTLMPGYWTCFKYTSPNNIMSEVCVGFLPGDTDESGTSEAQDVAVLEPCIRNPGSCEERLCDTDRSGLCAPGDILREVDLLAGAEDYAPGWEGESLAPCPTAVAP